MHAHIRICPRTPAYTRAHPRVCGRVCADVCVCFPFTFCFRRPAFAWRLRRALRARRFSVDVDSPRVTSHSKSVFLVRIGIIRTRRLFEDVCVVAFRIARKIFPVRIADQIHYMNCIVTTNPSRSCPNNLGYLLNHSQNCKNIYSVETFSSSCFHTKKSRLASR